MDGMLSHVVCFTHLLIFFLVIYKQIMESANPTLRIVCHKRCCGEEDEIKGRSILN